MVSNSGLTMQAESPCIDGEWTEPESGATVAVRTPAKNADVVATCHRADAADAGQAVAAGESLTLGSFKT
jgi:acyl-CoA reductase-like NAD-dependent aldehyde dehydrogenase